MESRPGFLLFKVHGDKAWDAFKNEGGGHRWQRIPPTEKKGRVHTSTVTVAILKETRADEVVIDLSDLDETFTRGSGAGGQHRNKTDTAVVLRHVPSGTTVRIDGGRSQHVNRQTALEVLTSRLKRVKDEENSKKANRRRRSQVGTGMRGDKIRTIALQRGQVTDHRTGKRIPSKTYLRGNLDKLF